MPLPVFFFLKSVILTLPLLPSLAHTLIPFPIFLGLFLEAAGPARPLLAHFAPRPKYNLLLNLVVFSR